ncbi:MAG: transcription termination/antitermination protein NusA [Firmicutes bacterium]|nr:transcription termination/antitermination protein NusA [Bacillota bacterium]
MNEFMNAIDDLVKEKGITKELLMDAIESALVAAYKKNYGTSQNVRVVFEDGLEGIEVLMRKDVVEEVEDEFTQISLEEALEIDPRYQVGDVVEYQVTPQNFGRIAAQTAKQVVVQKIREAERGMVFDNYINRQGDLITGVVQRISNETIFVNIGNTEGILVAGERARGERFRVNDRIKAYIMDVRKSTKGPQIFLSRTHPGFVERLFELEVPEIEDGIVEIKSIAREAGSRTKIAVYTEDEDVDPVGACVGTGGSRVRNIVDELFGEKIDITTWDDDPKILIRNVLSPAKVEEVLIDEEEKAATVIVPDYQLSLAIGKEGQNVRLAARLCGWKIDIKSHSQYFDSEDEYEDYDDEYYDDEYPEDAADEYVEEAAEEPAEEAEEIVEVADEEPAEEIVEVAEAPVEE